MKHDDIEAILSGRYGVLGPVLATCALLLWALRKGYLTWSRDKVAVAADDGSITVLASMQREIERLNAQLVTERKKCECEIAKLRHRVDELERVVSGQLSGGYQ
jgi:hypothetical protein